MEKEVVGEDGFVFKRTTFGYVRFFFLHFGEGLRIVSTWLNKAYKAQ